MELSQSADLFAISVGETVTKRNLYDLIQQSKVEGSPYWSGADMQIGNTPQQGINWLGSLPACQAVIIKTRPGSYDEDGWSSDAKEHYHYSFKARSGSISYAEKANQSLINQPQFGYPILLFSEQQSLWLFEGSFSVSEILDTYVRLTKLSSGPSATHPTQQEMEYREGGRKYVSHLMVERNRKVVEAAKKGVPWICEICSTVFSDRYGVEYIEAHHKIPVATYSGAYVVQPTDFALLCPNCHAAVHILMKVEDLAYQEIRKRLGGRDA